MTFRLHGELGRFLRLFRREAAWVAVFSFFANLLMLTPTLYMLQLFDRVMISGNRLTLLGLTLITVGLFLVMGFAEWVRSRLLVRAGARFDEALSRRIFGAAFEQSLRGGSGHNPTQPLTDLTTLRQFLSGSGPFAFFDLPWTFIYIGVLYLMHPWLGHAAALFSVVMLMVALAGNRLVSRSQKPALAAGLETSAYVNAKLRNAETIEALGMLPNLKRLWRDLHEREQARQATAADVAARMQAVTKFLQYAQQSVMLALGAMLVIDGHIGAGAMIASNALAGNALRPIGQLVGAWKQFVDARQAFGRLDRLLAEHPAARAVDESAPLAGLVELQGLTATVPGRPRPILDGLTARIEPGEVIAIVGPSGAGKSTLARCLVGVWPDVQGQILFDGSPLSARDREQLGAQLGYLPQDIELLDGTIAENIARFGQLDSQRVIEAASLAGIHEMVLRFSKGYDTPMGEAGSLLSGGQRQRIGLARALYGQPRVLVLDEPNASLDEAGEASLVRTVQDLKARGCTVFMIVHQRQFLMLADRVLVLNAGRIQSLGPLPSPLTQSSPASPTEVRA